jgi:hypothetical protein
MPRFSVKRWWTSFLSALKQLKKTPILLFHNLKHIICYKQMDMLEAFLLFIVLYDGGTTWRMYSWFPLFSFLSSPRETREKWKYFERKSLSHCTFFIDKKHIVGIPCLCFSDKKKYTQLLACVVSLISEFRAFRRVFWFLSLIRFKIVEKRKKSKTERKNYFNRTL